jgi:hypothetical protein
MILSRTVHSRLFRPVLLQNCHFRGSRRLHLAPPFLVDDYVPRYLQQQPKSLEQKKEDSINHLKQCNICPRYPSSLTVLIRRRCNVNRYERVGTCLIGRHLTSLSNHQAPTPSSIQQRHILAKSHVFKASTEAEQSSSQVVIFAVYSARSVQSKVN